LTSAVVAAHSVDVSTLPATAHPRHPSCPWAGDHFPADLPLEDYPSTMLTRLAQFIQQEVSSTYARTHGLSAAEWRVVARLNALGPTQLADFCRDTAMDKAYVSRLLRSLEPQGLITVTTDPAHGRRLILDITAKGKTLARRVLPQARAAQEQLLQVLEPREREVLYGAVKKLQSAIERGRAANLSRDPR
jgi:DNA-binding MarR family transcriptional regulator